MDRFDLRLEVPPVAISDLELPQAGASSAEVAARVAAARAIQAQRYAGEPGVRTNADAAGALLERVAVLDDKGRALLRQAAERLGLSARAWHRIRRVARTIADLAGREAIAAEDVAEAVGYRLTGAGSAGG